MLTRFLARHKFLCLLMVLGFVMVSSSFAVTDGSTVDTSTMDSSVNRIVDFFNGGWVKGICCILLIGECLGLLFAGGQNPQIFKKFLPFIVGTVLFMCAGKIISIIFGTNSTTFSNDLGMIEEKGDMPSLDSSSVSCV